MDEELLKAMVDDPSPDGWLAAADYLEENGLNKRAAHMRKRYARVKELAAVLHSVNLSQKLPVNTGPKLKEFGKGDLRVTGNEFKLIAQFYKYITRFDRVVRTYRYTDKHNRISNIQCIFDLDRLRMSADQGYTLMMVTFIVDKMYPIKSN